MRPLTATAAQRLTRSHRSSARLMVLDPLTFSVRAELSGATGVLVSGGVSGARGRVIRRTCQATLANPGGLYTPDELGDLLHVNSLIRLERGVYLDDETVEWLVLGHFLLGRPSVTVDATGATITVAGEDRAKLLVRSRFTVPTLYATGARIAQVIATEAETAGMGATHYRLEDGGKTLARDRVFEEDESRDTALSSLARDYGLELYTDADGYLTCGPPPDPSSAAVAWSFAPDADATMLGLTKEWTDDRLYNHVLVTGESSDPAHPPVRAEAMDTNPASPAYIGGPLGDRLYRYTSAMIVDVPQAAEVAAGLLTEVALLEEAIALSSVTNPALEPGDLIAVAEPLSHTEGRYLVDTIDTPLELGTQSLGTKIARALA